MTIKVRLHVLAAALKDGWPTWLAIAGLGVAFVIGCAGSSNTSAKVRYAGTALQVLGLSTVAVGLHQVRRLFGTESILQKLQGWWTQVTSAFVAPKPTSVQGASIGISTVVGQAAAFQQATPATSLEGRVAILEANMNGLRELLDAKEQTLRGDIFALGKKTERESQTRASENREIKHTMQELAIGGLHLEFVGLLWLVLGVLGTSIPDEIAGLIAALRRAV
jgi:hypothetical protein